MTTRELAGYLKLHEITICKYAANGQIPAIRIGRVWRFDKEAIDEWIIRGQRQTHEANKQGNKAIQGHEDFDRVDLCGYSYLRLRDEIEGNSAILLQTD